MARIKSKIDAIVIPAAATPAAAAAIVAAKMGDNATVKATELEGVILRAASSNADLLDALRRCDTNQKELQQRAFAARWYAGDYMEGVAMGKTTAKRDSGGNVIIPAMTDAVRKAYLAKLIGKTADKAIIQRRSTLRTWWTRLLFAAGVKTMEARGGKRTRVVKDTKAKPAPAATTAAPAAGGKPTLASVPPATPKATTPMEAAAFLRNEGALMLRFVNMNLDPPMRGKPSPTEAFAKLVSDFIEGVAKIGKQLEKQAKAKPAK